MKIPQTLGRYEVVDLIAQGGMCALYRARDPHIGRYVAIKLLRPDYDTPELRDRFSREARAAGGLSHQNIVTIYDVGEHEGLPFIAMEYVRGDTFADLVCLRPPLSLPRKLQLTEEVCAGLAHAHEAGIVHRDIKPANLIVGPEGTAKILDFGIAKLTATGMTMPGSILGTLNYMSPEQVMGAAVDARADIFSLGAVLYELLSHQPAFPGDDPDQVLHEILEGVPTPITEYCPDIDPRLVRLVDRMLEKDPDRRFQNIAFVQKELAGIRLNPQAAIGTPSQPAAAARKTPSPATPDPNRLRVQQIDEHLLAAGHAFEAGDYDAAIDSCRQVLMLDASDGRALSYVDRIHAAIDARQTAVRLAIDRGKSAFSGGDLATALRDVKQALALDPHNTEARGLGDALGTAIRERQEEARIRAAVDDARRLFYKGNHQAALQSLKALQPTNTLVEATYEELRVALRAIDERQRVENEMAAQRRRITALLANVRTALNSGRLVEASQMLVAVRGLDPTVPELPDLTERLHQAQAAARLKADLARVLGDFDEQLAQGRLVPAGDVLKTAAALDPDDPLVHSARQRLEQAMAAVAEKEAADARRREAEQKIDEAAARLQTGDLVGAAEMLKLAANLVPQHPRAAALSERLREAVAHQQAAEAAERLKRVIQELIRGASQRLQSADDTANLMVALRDVNQALALDARNAEAVALRKAVEDAIAVRREAARVRTTINNARRRFANGKHRSAIKLLEDAHAPSQPEIAAALSELREALVEIEERRRSERERAERDQRVAAWLAEARTMLETKRFDAALDLVSKVEALDSAAPGLAALKKQVGEEQAAARLRDELERVLADLDQHLARGEWSEASDRMRDAAALGPSDARVLLARQRVDQAIASRDAAEARRRELDEHHAAAKALLERGDLHGAMRLLTLAANLDPQHPDTVQLSGRVTEAIKQQEAAEAAERLRRDVDELLAAADMLLRSPDRQAADVMSATQKIAQALALSPDHAGAHALKVTAEQELSAVRANARIDAVIRNAFNRLANGKHQSALQLLESLDASNPTVAEALKQVRGAIRDMRKQRRTEEEMADTAIIPRDIQAAFGGQRVGEKIDALSGSRPGEAKTAGPAEWTKPAAPGEAAQAPVAREKKAAAHVDQREPQTPARRERPGSRRVVADEDATVFMPMGGVDAIERGVPAQGGAPGDWDAMLTDVRIPEGIPPGGPVARPRAWPLMVGAGLLLFAILAVLLRLWS